MLKLLEPFRKFTKTDEETKAIMETAYNYYQTRDPNVFSEEQSNEDNILISYCVRFFKCINSSKKVDEEFFNNYIKLELFKGKQTTIEFLMEKIAEIKEIQSTRFLFELADKNDSLKYVPMKNYAKGKNIRKITNFEYKIEVVVSNHFSNRVLIPQIYFIFTFDDGTVLKTQISIRLFNEFRKNLALNIKKIIQNESVPLLK